MDKLSQISLQYLSHAVRTRWRTALAVTLIIFASLAAYIFSLRLAYTSAALVLLAPVSEELEDNASGRIGAMTDPFFIRSETVILSSDELCRAVIDRLKLWDVSEFQPRDGLMRRLGLRRAKTQNPFLSQQEVLLDHVVRYYKDQLHVFNDGRSKTVEISFTAADPQTASKVANAHAEAYMQEQSTRRAGTQQKAIEWLSREVDARGLEVRDADAQVQQYQLNHGIVSTNDVTMVERGLAQLSSQLVEAQRQLSTQLAALSEIKRIRAGGDPGNAAGLLTDDPLKSLLQSRVEKEAGIASLEKRLTANHPTLVKQREELVSINKVLNTQLRRLESAATSNASSWKKQVDDLNRAVSLETSRKVSQDGLAAGLPALVAQAQVKRTVFETVLSRYQTLLAERAFSAPAASIVSRAVPSARPSFPKTGLFLVIAAMVSSLAGAAAAIGLQLRKPTSMGLVAIADSLGIRPLVSVPRFRNRSRVNGVIQMEDPRLFIESIRFLRDAILERQQNLEGATCLVTSVLPRQGKSLIAMSLARAISRTGRKTLFMEIDLRRPTGSTLARRAPPAAGLAAVLEGRAAIGDVIVQDKSTGLDMLLAEMNAGSALDRLTPACLRELLGKLRIQYDAIVIDSPPVGIVSDALTIAPLVDQTLIVAKDGDSSFSELKRATRLLQDRGATVAGLVLTSIDPHDMSSVDKKTLHRYVLGVPVKAVR
jgi:capsular exopolysaccharide synthesis family protein